MLHVVSWNIASFKKTQIQANLESLGIQRVRIIDEQLPMDYCDDCGTPLFPDLNAELVHPGSPDEDEHSPSSRVVH